MGLIAAVALPAMTITEIYTCPEGESIGFNINLCNRGDPCNVGFAVTFGTVPGDAHWVEYDYPLPHAGALERTGRTLSPGQKIYAYATAATVSVSVDGVESAA